MLTKFERYKLAIQFQSHAAEWYEVARMSGQAALPLRAEARHRQTHAAYHSEQARWHLMNLLNDLTTPEANQ
ncbi:hypothetical protein [Taklimakanibacter albus]|uniref:Uncharacterized protein n=1 Tax=Taklimakanibacter albus TaxID=2800327 RepID=A0ACC5RGQ4_9HYPH|nr:hypothetical protein [Aestuariivirga sp. YIM B02566]MBK1871583.1 hypothetical protein [Aestuariivirga sp. YIM B02566]